MAKLIPLQLFKCLSDETRLSIMFLLQTTGELCVCDITAAIMESQPKTSRHLAMLREAGLISDRREGKWIYYRLSPQMPVWAATILTQAVNSQLSEVTELVKRLEHGKAACQ
ncbi:metalloregulator ArsR/SmtB family transcription factor [Rahnella sp. PD12R]|uniref:metalloregulator ArsR/SmtB family transcription factor n=1 Tax=unclassified Rahnella TaxID=2635087 RepID=UPI001C25644F|nr:MULTISPECIES: metalloregulator ArsR/SmtB family transcription factor [unclassified Rahnella]MBU9819161.1 metalloregulator ArsR/SmtB family transcription factor [Rahnella sp. BCC 1045]MBV6820958.1 metalloregulator ArsR/SmtB family transcription factor [Rahnella sp. PD12R]